MYSKIIWPLIIVVTAVLTLAFIVGFITSMGISSSKSGGDVSETDVTIDPPPAIENGVNNILVMGDSIGFGFGDDNNKGLGNRYAELAKEASDIDMEVYNLSISGAVTEGLLQVVSDPATESYVQGAELIILSIGGNDVNRLMRESSLSLVSDYDAVLRSYLENLESILDVVRSDNPVAQIAVIGLYNPYGEEVGDDKVRLLLEWNYETQLLVAGEEGIVYVPTYDHFTRNLDNYLYIDDFHPSAQGYDLMANELYDILNGR